MTVGLLIKSEISMYHERKKVMIQSYQKILEIDQMTQEELAFKVGYRNKSTIAKIENGDSSVDPYMDFANQYPVRDSMRMMRLLYRLGLGAQENKHQHLQQKQML